MTQIKLRAPRTNSTMTTTTTTTTRARFATRTHATTAATATVTAATATAAPSHIMKMKRKRKIPEISLLIAAIWINSFCPWSGHGGGVPLAYCSHMPGSAAAALGGVAAYTVDAAHLHASDMHHSHHYDDGGGGSSSSMENMAMHGGGHDMGGMPEESEERDHIAHHFEMQNHEELLEDIRDDTSVNLIPEKDLPKFGEPLQNVTIPVGREAILQCVVDNLQTYK
ncbi:PREDICTED: uncharacterized protein LOC108365142, partial [Rhagoletis zephyria]|uniref:uncharacterized protein LOC108365142 n=1 Tax=Rhagoletis zephyria TaxID=28612 RepID=UPI0008117CB0